MRQRWFSKRALQLHLAAVVWVPLCLACGWWQVTRALGGNALSYLYSVEWPVFAVVGVAMWWVLIHTDPDTVGARAQRRVAVPRTGQATAPAAPVRRREDEDEALAAYNDRLAELALRDTPQNMADPVSGPEVPAGPVPLGPDVAPALRRYRIMAVIVGIGLLILVFVGVPLQYAAGKPQVAAIVGPIHGFLYIVYLLAGLDLARRARFTLWQLAAMIGAGFIPFLAFVVEHRVTLRVRSQMAEVPAGA